MLTQIQREEFDTLALSGSHRLVELLMSTGLARGGQRLMVSRSLFRRR